jgi:hypothetical protein
VQGFSFERLSQALLEHADLASETVGAQEIEARLATFAIRAVMPRDIADVPLEQVLKLREKYAGESERFQEFVQSVAAELPGVSEARAQEFVNDYVEARFNQIVRPKLDELEDAIYSAGLTPRPTIINLEARLPVELPGMARVLVMPVLGMISTAALAVGTLRTITDRRKAARTVIERSDVAYLMHVRQDLTPAGSLEWLSQQSRKQVFGA